MVPKSQPWAYEPTIMTHCSVINICMLHQKKIRQGEVLGVYLIGINFRADLFSRTGSARKQLNFRAYLFSRTPNYRGNTYLYNKRIIAYRLMIRCLYSGTFIGITKKGLFGQYFLNKKFCKSCIYAHPPCARNLWIKFCAFLTYCANVREN